MKIPSLSVITFKQGVEIDWCRKNASLLPVFASSTHGYGLPPRPYVWVRGWRRPQCDQTFGFLVFSPRSCNFCHNIFPTQAIFGFVSEARRSECSRLQSATLPSLAVHSYVQTSTINQLRHRALSEYHPFQSFSTKQQHVPRYSQSSPAEHGATSMLSRGCACPIPHIFAVLTYQLPWAWKVLKR